MIQLDELERAEALKTLPDSSYDGERSAIVREFEFKYCIQCL